MDDRVRVLKDLKITPKGWAVATSGPFQPKYHNWRLEAKAPILILNATTLNTGHNWQFTTSFMGESPLSIDPEVDGNNRLRRLYYDDAPTEELKQFRLARAAGASACVPVLFEPIALDRLYPDKTIRLADGGVHDNQGVVGLLEQDCTVMLVSDASGSVGVEDAPDASELKVAVRSNDLLMARVRGAQYRDLKARLRSRVVRGLMFLHLRKDLDVDPIAWVGCKDGLAGPNRKPSTSYGILKDIQKRLAAIRTDLDSFGEAEAFALMTSGYCMTDHVFPESVGKLLVETHQGREPWEFLKIRDLLTGARKGSDADHADLLRVLDAGKHQFLKFVYLSPSLTRAVRIARWIVFGLAFVALCYVWWAYSSYSLLTVGTLVRSVVLMLLGLFGLGWLPKVLYPSQAIFAYAQNLGIAIVGKLVAIFQLNVLDPWYLRRHRDYRKMLTPECPAPGGSDPPPGNRDS